jgi:hypothetical protein
MPVCRATTSGAHLGQVTFGYGPVEADHRQVIRPEVVPAAHRGDQDGVRTDPGREISVPGMRQQPGPHQAHRDIHHGPAEREMRQ